VLSPRHGEKQARQNLHEALGDFAAITSKLRLVGYKGCDLRYKLHRG
jgi:hypothetical protein